MTKTWVRPKYALTTGMFVLSIIVSQFLQITPASAAAVTWVGGGSDTNFSTGANWSGGVAPVDGDSIVLASGSSTSPVYVNDIVGLDLAGITSTGQNGNTVTINGNDLTISGNITHNAVGSLILGTNITLGANVVMTGNVSFAGSGKSINIQNYNLDITNSWAGCRTINGLSGSGNVSIATYVGSVRAGYNFQSANTGFTGGITITAGNLVIGSNNAFANASGITASGDGTVVLGSFVDRTIPAPLTLSGTGSIAAQRSGGSAGSCTVQTYDIINTNTVTTTLSGPVTLQSDFVYAGIDDIRITGVLAANGHKFTAKNGAGTLTTPNGIVTSSPFTTQVSDVSTAQLIAINKETVVLSGERGQVIISRGANVKGTGVADALVVIGIVNPGNSPGTLTVKTLYGVTDGGVQEVEILNKDTYDKIVTGADFTLPNAQPSPVNFIGTATLRPILYEGWSINQGDTFTIVDNLSAEPVNGTYTGLAEGAQFTVDGITFSITYVGGDGNDIVLTALNTGSDPTAPNTGVAKLLGNPVVVAGLGIVTAVSLIAIAIRRRSTR